MATNNNGDNQNLNVGLNLNGNALASVEQLIKHMTQLREVAVSVGNAMNNIQGGLTIQEMKKLNAQMKQLTTTPATIQNQYYQGILRNKQSQNLSNIVNTTNDLRQPNVMQQLLQQYDPKLVKKGLEIRLSAAELKSDTKKIKQAQLELQTFKAEMEKYTLSLKGLTQLKQEQDRLVYEMMSTPIGSAALTANIQGRLNAQYKTGADQKRINEYMANPKNLKPNNTNLVSLTDSDLRAERQANAAKIEATKRLMGQFAFDSSSNAKVELENYTKILNALELEKTKLDTINGLKRGKLRIQNDEIQQLAQMNNLEKASRRLENLTKGRMNVDTLSAEKLVMLPTDNLLQRELAMKSRLKQANEALRLAESLQNKEAIKGSRDMIIAYNEELKMIARRKKQIEDLAKPKTTNDLVKETNLIAHYSSNPNLLKPKNNISANMSADELIEAQFKNQAKIKATQGLINKIDMNNDAQAEKSLDKHIKILAALKEEQARLQAINSARRTGVNLRDEELKKIKEATNKAKASENLNALISKDGFSVKTLNEKNIKNLSMDNLYQREMAMVDRLKQVKEAMRLSDSLGNTKALEESTRLRLAYEKEIRLLRERIRENNKQEVTKVKGNVMVDRYHQMADGESSGALLGMQGILLRNYMLWGAFAGAIAGSYSFLRDYEQALKQTQAISQATNTQVERLSENILKVAENSRFSAIEITEAATTLAQAGFSMSDIEKTLESVTLLATATGSTLKETVDIATASLGAFQLSAENMPSIVNQITQAMNLSKLDIQKFQLAVQYAGNAASDAGLNFEELLASVSTVANAGVRSGSTLGTGFRQLLSDLISPSAKFEKILGRLGLTTADVDVRTNGLVGTLKQLKDAGFSTADAYESFEVRSVAFYTALANNLSTYDDLLANLDSNTAAMDANEIQMGSLSAQTDRMFNQFKALAEVLGSPIRDGLTIFFNLVGDTLIMVKDLTDNGVAKFIVQVGATSLAIGGTVVVIKGMITTVMGLITTLTAAGVAARGAAAAITGVGVSTATTATVVKSFVPIVFALSTVVAAVTIGMSKMKNSTDLLKDAVEQSRTSVNDLKDAANSLQSTIIETDKKIVSLESRFENLKDDPAAVAVEMSNLQNKAIELGISLKTDLTNGITSVIEGWRELRIELGKEIAMNLDRQFEELNLLSERMSLLRSQEERNKAPLGSEAWLKEVGVGFVSSYSNLKQSAANTEREVLTFGDSYLIRKDKKLTLEDIFSQVVQSKENKQSGLTSERLMSILNTLDTGVRNLDAYTPEQLIEKQKEWNKEAGVLVSSLRAASKDYRFFINNNNYSKEIQDNARNTVASLTALIQKVDSYQNLINSAASPAREAKTANAQGDVQKYQNEYEQKAEQLRKLPVAQHKNLKYNDPRLDSYIIKYGKETGQEWLIPLILAIKNDGEKSNMNQKSRSGAKSVMQFIPSTWEGNNGAKGYNIDPKTGRKRDLNNAVDVIEAAFQYMGDSAKRYKTQDARVLAAEYNGGYRAAQNVLKGGKGIVNSDGTPENINYVARVSKALPKYQNIDAYAASLAKSSKGQKGYTTVGSLELSENLTDNLNRKDFLEDQKRQVMDSLKALGDLESLNAADRARAEEYQKRIVALDKIISQTNSELMNGLRNKQLEHQEEIKKKDKQFKLEEQRLTQNIEQMELEIEFAEKQLAQGNLTNTEIAEMDAMYRRLGDAKANLLALQNQMGKNLMFEYKEDQIITDSTLLTMADEALENNLQKLNKEIQQKREKNLEAARKAFIDRISNQNAEFVRELKNELDKAQAEFKDASEILDFAQRVTERNNSEATGLTQLKRERALMDDVRFRDNYTDTQRQSADKEIEKLTAMIKRDSIFFEETRLKQNQEQIKILESLIESAEIKRSQHEAEINALIANAQLSDTEKKELTSKLQTELNKTKKEVYDYRKEVFALEDKTNELEDLIKTADGSNTPKQASLGELFGAKIDRQYEDLFKASTLDNNITSVIESVNSAFGTLIETAWNASDSFDDFFKILIGGSHESKEAFKAFGYGILQTMMKILQDAIVTKFLKTMKDIYESNIKPSSGGSSGFLGGLLSTVGSAVAGAFTGGVSTATPQVQHLSQGGLIRGSAKNVDSVPIMAADSEYMLPSNVTETVGIGFLEHLRKDPQGFKDSKYNINNIMAKESKPSVTNVYVVSPDRVPSSTSQNDIIVAVEDNIVRGGSVHKLIKQVASNG